MKKTLRWMMVAVGALALLACGEASVTPDVGIDGEEARGELRVGFSKMSGVDRVEVEVQGPVERTMTVTASPWYADFGAIQVGNYSVTATAYDADDEAIYAGSTTFLVERNQQTNVILVMGELDSSSDHTALRFVSIKASTISAQPNEYVTYEVEAAPGNVGTLHELSIRQPSSATPPFYLGTPDPAVPFGGDTVATIGWTAPDEDVGQVWFVLVITDTAGNKAEIGIDLYVIGHADAAFNFQFNEAPTVDITQTKLLNDAEGTHLFLSVTYKDDTETVDAKIYYEWTWACDNFGPDDLPDNPLFEVVWGGGSGRLGEVAPGTKRSLEFHIQRSQDPNESLEDKIGARSFMTGYCTLTVELTDPAEPTLTSEYDYVFNVDWPIPPANP